MTDVVSDEPGEERQDETAIPPFFAVTFNTGTGGKAPNEDNFGYHSQQAGFCDEHYGNGLSWKPFVEMTRQWLETVDPDLMVFQEIFWTGDCPLVPEEAWEGFVCEDWASGEETVIQMLLADEWQIMCNPGKPDKCAAINRRFGSFQGCDEDFCLEGMSGTQIDGCGKGVRIGKAVIELVDGGQLTLVNVHGSSGFSADDAECRTKQFSQVFVDGVDGEPLANGARNLILGDFNTDPGRLADTDPSAALILGHAGENKPFHFVTEVGPEVQATYGGLFNIDHVISDALEGACWHAGVTEGHDPVMDAFFFDHVPAVCTLETPDPSR